MCNRKLIDFKSLLINFQMCYLIITAIEVMSSETKTMKFFEYIIAS